MYDKILLTLDTTVSDRAIIERVKKLAKVKVINSWRI
jgi:hypothetical protein